MNIQKIPQWYAFVTKPRHEKKVKHYLDLAGIRSFLPMKTTLNQWKDRKKWVETPLFSCYIFTHIAYIYRYDVLTIPSVARMVGFNNEPTPVPDRDIEAIQILISTRQELDVMDGYLPGDRVKILSGPLARMEGELVELRQRKWFVIYIPAIEKSVLVDAEGNRVEKI